jgi:hypothetical protein
VLFEAGWRVPNSVVVKIQDTGGKDRRRYRKGAIHETQRRFPEVSQ